MDKAELRRAVIARRDALDLDLRAAKSAVICARLVELLGRLDAAAPHTVAVYAAMGSERQAKWPYRVLPCDDTTMIQ